MGWLWLPVIPALPFSLSQPALCNLLAYYIRRTGPDRGKGKDAFRCGDGERTWDSFAMIRGTPSVAYSFFFVKGGEKKDKNSDIVFLVYLRGN
jgi:hypothetical protein